MNHQSQDKFNWRSALGAFAIFLVTLGIIESPAVANPNQVQDNFKLSQVGIRSRIKAPTPLNLRPQTHFPLPASRYNQRQDYYRNPGYRGSPRGHRQYKGSNRYGRYDHDHYQSRRTRSSVIIINPANSSYSNSSSHSSSYIRVIRK
ncbi:MAG: hypothetical protein WBM86_14125 [Waterburya sp.]